MQDYERSKLRRTALNLARTAAAVLFGASALMKTLGFAPFVNLFRGDEFCFPAMRYVVGSVELVGVILVLRERSALVGAMLLLGVTVFATFHVLHKGQSPLPLVILVALAGGLSIVEGRRKRARAGSRRRD